MQDEKREKGYSNCIARVLTSENDNSQQTKR